jgi:hypothetical protein
MAIKIPIFADYNDKGVKEAEGSFKDFGGKVGDIAAKAAAAFLAIGTAAAVGAWKAVDLASDLAESQSKVGVIFGDSSTAVEDFAGTAAKQFGLSKQAVLDAAGTFGIFGKAAGLNGDKLSTFSNDFTGLAADFASFNNTTPEEAIQAIGAALRGESEPIRKYGIMLDDATLKAEAMAQGIYDGKGPLTQQQKILAAQAAIMKQSSTAQGDFARTSGGLANQQRIMKAEFANVVTTIGTKLLPVFMTLVGFVSEKVIPVIESVTKVFSEEGFSGIVRLVQEQLPKLKELLIKGANSLWEWIQEATPPALKKLGELLVSLANWIVEDGLPMLVDKLVKLGNALVEWIKPNIAPMLSQLGDLLIALGQWILTVAVPKITEQALKLAFALVGWVASVAPEILKGLGGLLIKIGSWVVTDGIPAVIKYGADLGGSLIGALVDALKNIGSKGIEVGKAFANGMIDFINKKVIDAINDLVKFKISAFGVSYTVDPPDIPHIPQLANGGIVMSPTLALIGEAGPEAVVPLNKANRQGQGFGGGNTNITVNVNGGDPNSIVRALQQYVRQSGPVPVNTRTM